MGSNGVAHYSVLWWCQRWCDAIKVLLIFPINLVRRVLWPHLAMLQSTVREIRARIRPPPLQYASTALVCNVADLESPNGHKLVSNEKISAVQVSSLLKNFKIQEFTSRSFNIWRYSV